MTDISLLSGPAWDLKSEYQGVKTADVDADLSVVRNLTTELAELAKQMGPLVLRADCLNPNEETKAIELCQQASKIHEKAAVLLWNLSTYFNCVTSCDATDEAAKAQRSYAKSVGASLELAYAPFQQFLKMTSDQVMARYLDSQQTKHERFIWRKERSMREHSLSLAEEELLIALNVDGPNAWGTLYENLAGTLKVKWKRGLETASIGLAEAAMYLRGNETEVRKEAFHGINSAWTGVEESAAAILNALVGWRHTTYQRRSIKKQMHYLDTPLNQSHVSRATIEAMFSSVNEVKTKAQKIYKLKARALGVQKMGPWDLFAPCPAVGGAWNPPSFDRAIDVIADSFNSISPEMGQFVRMCADKNWIEGRVGGAKRPGAYCTFFPKSRTPRVYMTYAGNMNDLKTLAHELGHAFHAWVMRDLSFAEHNVPMTLAETASIFGENVVKHSLLENATHPSDRLTFLWAQANEVESFFLNIPARFTFESQLCEKRRDGVLSPSELRELMSEAWNEWYGESLSQPDPMFWASKLHFAISDLSFYNFPYTFGYLFSLGVYAQREKMGAGFFEAYKSLLCDTGRMTAEEVAAKHLGVDLTKQDFWRSGVATAMTVVDDLDAALVASGY